VQLKQFAELFVAFARVGVMTFGGGYAMLPILQREIVEQRGWATEAELTDYFAIGQCTPGVIAVNTATFIGHKRGGIAGGIAATLGVVFPSVVIITLIAAFLRNFAEYPLVKNAFAGIRVVVCVLILNAVVKLGKSTLRDLPAVIIFLVTFALAAFLKVTPVLLVPAAALAGVIVSVVKRLGVKR